MKRFIFLLTIFFAQCNLLYTQVNDSIITPQKPESYIRLQYENDYFSATDGYFTQGIQLSVIQKALRYSPIAYALIPLSKKAVNYYGIHFEQDCFTPHSIRYTTLNYNERNYAAVFFMSHSLSSLNPEKKIALHTQLDLGIIGPCAKCEEEQKGIHATTNNLQPLGWENQVKTDYIINYRTKIEEGIYSKKYREIIGQTSVRLGTLYTDVSIGLTARIGFFSPYFSNLGMDKYHIYRKKNFQFYAIAKLNAKAVAYNATLQGGLFNRTNIYTISDERISRIVIDALTGFVLTFRRTSLEFSKIYITQEFREGLNHGWEKVVISYSF
jgi:lipid A 3-O-deacylase